MKFINLINRYYVFMVRLLLVLFLFGSNVLNAQSVTGKLVNQNEIGLAGLQLKLYSSPHISSAKSTSDGSFTFDNISDVEVENQLPTGYSVSNNFPNPFNPKTRIYITLSNNGNVRITVFNILGQKVRDEVDRYFRAGTNYIDLELNGLPNGMYLANINLDGKYSVTKKLMLLYGSQHLNTGAGSPSFQLKSPTTSISSMLDTKIDSIVVTGILLGKRVFTGFPNIDRVGTFDLGSLVINIETTDTPCVDIPTVVYAGKTYNTVQIGTQCWLKENLDIGTMIQGSQEQTDNNVIEKYCYNNDTCNCAKYGGLYQWAEAVQYKYSSSNSTYTDPESSGDVQGICPSGWHIPNYSEFIRLAEAVNGDGNALKAIGQDVGSTNTSGFSALLTGYNEYGNYFLGLDIHNGFWTSSEDGTDFAAYMRLDYNLSNITNINSYMIKVSGFSVRCIKDYREPLIHPTVTTTSISNITFNSAISGGYVREQGGSTVTARGVCWSTSENPTISDNKTTDSIGIGIYTSSITGLHPKTLYYVRAYATNSYITSYGSQISFRTSFPPVKPCPGIPTITYAGKTYNTVQIDSQCWLKESLDIGTMIQGNENATNNGVIEKYCYNNDTSNCAAYGGLYQWAEAMQYKNGATNSTSRNPAFSGNVQGICPTGWHIPTAAEFNTLASAVNNDGNALKAIGQGLGSGEGTNTSGFSALLSTYRHTNISYNNYFGFFGSSSLFWSSTEYDSEYAYQMNLYKDGNIIAISGQNIKYYGFSIRCLKD